MKIWKKIKGWFVKERPSVLSFKVYATIDKTISIRCILTDSDEVLKLLALSGCTARISYVNAYLNPQGGFETLFELVPNHQPDFFVKDMDAQVSKSEG